MASRQEMPDVIREAFRVKCGNENDPCTAIHRHGPRGHAEYSLTNPFDILNEHPGSFKTAAVMNFANGVVSPSGRK